MLDFIICDNDKWIVTEVEKIIHSVMINNNHKYQIHSFYDYDDKFDNITNQKSENKIYILDIEVNGKTGIDMAREIRAKDQLAHIIFLSQYENKYKDGIFQSTIRYFAFVNKSDLPLLKTRIEELLKELKKINVVCFDDRGDLYTLKKESILFVTTNKRKSRIVTDYDHFDVNKTLKELQDLLGSSFIKTKNSYLINKKRVLMYSLKERTITFDNHQKESAISKKYTKETFYNFMTNEEKII